jgi:hypothetical protein
MLFSHQRCAAAGSIDDTEAIVAKTMDGVPGQLLHSKFIDFAQVVRVLCPRDVSLHSLIGLPLIKADHGNVAPTCGLVACCM